jgi:hypothetical protein
VFRQFLIEGVQKRQVPVLMVDEAHKIPPDVLEEIRLLGNLELAEGKLLQIVMAGQTELRDVLNRESMRQLKQRIAVRLAIYPLCASDVRHYMQHRWQKAGAMRPLPFQPEAVVRIARYSRGIPRLVNVLSDNALMLAYREGGATVSAAQIVQVARNLDMLDGPGGPSRRTRVLITTTPLKTDVNGNAGRTANGIAREVASEAIGVLGTIPTLEAYRPPASPPPRLMRLAGRLGLTIRPVPQIRTSSIIQ